jgi:hypothetical protein
MSANLDQSSERGSGAKDGDIGFGEGDKAGGSDELDVQNDQDIE